MKIIIKCQKPLLDVLDDKIIRFPRSRAFASQHKMDLPDSVLSIFVAEPLVENWNGYSIATARMNLYFSSNGVLFISVWEMAIVCALPVCR